MVPAYRYVLADVFTGEPLAGNPVAVFTDARDLEGGTMQRIARELNLSETVFVLPPERGGHARIRIFTPTVELPFAGHPVLGTAFVLGAPLQLATILLEVGVGEIPVELERDESWRIVFGRMTQPVPRVEPLERADELFAALRVEGSELPVERYDNGVRHVILVLGSRDEVIALEPDIAALRRVGEVGVSCLAGEGAAWKSRMFAPALGVVEDPATGSAAGPIACHLARHGRIGWGEEIVIEQGAEIGRPSTLHARADGGAGLIDRVVVGGQAVVVARGELRL